MMMERRWGALLLVVLVVLSLLPPAPVERVDEQVARMEEYKKLIIDANSAPHHKNINPDESPDASQLRTLDSIIKRNAAVIKKLKMISVEQNGGLVEELKNVNVSKLVSEAVSRIREAKLCSADMQADVQVEKKCTDLRNFVHVVQLGEAEPKLEGELSENTCSISDAFENSEYPVGNGKALHFAYVVMPGSMDPLRRGIAGILPLVGLAEVVLIPFAAAIIAITMGIKALISRRSGILIVVAFVLAASIHVHSVPAALPDIVALDFGDSYNAFFDLMHTALEANTQIVRGHYILPPEMDMDDEQIPTRWISVQVTGDSNDLIAVTYFRADNIYLVGFMNSVGTLYCTDDAVNMFPIAGCIPLGFTSNYHDLTERPSKSLDLGLFMQEALLGREGAKEAANVLASYGATMFDQSAVKNAMLTYSIMIAEAMRFRPIGNLVRENWEHSTVLPRELCNLPFVWQDLSILWCRGDEITEDEPEWSRAIERLGKAYIRNEEDVDMALDLVKYEKDCRNLRIVNP